MTVPFGYKCRWLAVERRNAAAAVAGALGLRRRERAAWARGVDLAYESWDTTPGEGDVMALAGRWSVDPTAIEGVITDGEGIVGTLRGG